MSDRIYNAFDSVHADEELKGKTADFVKQKLLLSQKQYKREKRAPYFLKYAIPAVCFLLAVFGYTGYSVYTTPVAAISIDVNPSVEFGVNRFDRVVTVDCYNDDAVKMTENLKLHNLTYENAIAKLLEKIKELEYFKKDAVVSISVAADDSDKSTQMQQRIDACTGHGRGKVRCKVANTEDMHHAHEAGLSFGKYEAFLELKELDPSVSVEDVKGLSMREIRDRIDACKGEGHDDESGENERKGHGQKKQEGHGNGEGQKNGGGHRRRHGHM